jgi:hypothetical protein
MIRNFVNFVIRNFVMRNFVVRNFDIRNLVPAPICIKLIICLRVCAKVLEPNINRMMRINGICE